MAWEAGPVPNPMFELGLLIGVLVFDFLRDLPNSSTTLKSSCDCNLSSFMSVAMLTALDVLELGSISLFKLADDEKRDIIADDPDSEGDGITPKFVHDLLRTTDAAWPLVSKNPLLGTCCRCGSEAAGCCGSDTWDNGVILFSVDSALSFGREVGLGNSRPLLLAAPLPLPLPLAGPKPGPAPGPGDCETNDSAGDDKLDVSGGLSMNLKDGVLLFKGVVDFSDSNLAAFSSSSTDPLFCCCGCTEWSVVVLLVSSDSSLPSWNMGLAAKSLAGCDVMENTWFKLEFEFEPELALEFDPEL